MEHDATWNVDSKKRKREFASAGLNATARDFAKLGQLYLNKGKWKGQQIIDEQWTSTIANGDTMNKYNGYKNQWWSRANNRNGAFSAIGFSQITCLPACAASMTIWACVSVDEQIATA